MKKLILALASITLLTSCYDEGEIVSNPKSVYEINGKKYKFVEVAPESTTHRFAWIMIPLDSAENMPQVIVSEQPNGKNSTKLTSTIILN
jgi:hypothetical protein